MEDNKTYRVERFFLNGGSRGPNGGSYREVVSEGLTLAEAKEHCEDDESSWKTATSAEAQKRTREKGEWFDGFYEE